MKLAVIGATGFVGQEIVREALERGHSVTALVRDTGKVPPQPNLNAISVDINDATALAEELRGHDAVLSAFNPGWGLDNQRERFQKGFAAIKNATKTAGVSRLLVVGGAGSLEVAPGVQVLDNPDFPPQFRPGAEGARDALLDLRQEQELEWTYVSPSANLQPGERTGQFRLGTDQLIVGEDGQSRISTADLAVAILDETEKPQFIRQRFTAGY